LRSTLATQNRKKWVKTPVVREDQLAKLGAGIKVLRIPAGYGSYETFSYEHGLPSTQYGRYEQGKDLRFSGLMTVIAAFGLSLEEFFKDGF
jgi:hypothetical protein